MKRLVVLLFILATPLLISAGEGADAKKELKALEGKWKAVSMEAGGKELPKEALPEFIFTVGANGKSTAKFGKNEEQATIAVDPKKTPRTIDNSHESGANKGKKQYGIYKLEGNRWTVCMTRPGAAETDRPKDFTTKDTTNVTFVFERIKEEKK
jgi:uncharacterized protein (TIGR03067 family)